MFCDRCGAENKDSAAFCRKCGEPLESTEVETRVVPRPPAYAAPPVEAPIEKTGDTAQDEATIFTITPTLMFVKAGYILAGVGALLLVALIAGLTNLSVIIAIVVGLMMFLIPAYFHVRQKLVRYMLTETSLEIGSGLLATSTRNVPLRRIQDVTVSATALQRIAGLGDIVIDNASEQGGKVVLRNVDSPRRYGDMLLKQMSKLER